MSRVAKTALDARSQIRDEVGIIDEVAECEDNCHDNTGEIMCTLSEGNMEN
jgi:hypothetical protein